MATPVDYKSPEELRRLRLNDDVADVDRDQKGKQQHGGTPEQMVALGCGCRYMSETGLPVAYCKAHDRRTSRVKVGAALADLANWLDEAWKTVVTDGQGNNFITSIYYEKQAEALKNAAKAALRASKAIIGGDEI